MAKFKENFIRLCNEKKVAPSKVCKEVGLSSAAFSLWTDDSVPRRATIMRIADYFGITAEKLLEEKKESSTSETMDEREQVLLELFRLVPDGQKDEVINLIHSALKMQGLSK